MGVGVCSRTLEDLVDVIGCQLNDLDRSVLLRTYEAQGETVDPDDLAYVIDHLRWSEEFITSVINDGLRIFAIERPDLFTDLVCVEPIPGRIVQPVPDECVEVKAIEYAVDCDEDYFPINSSKSQMRAASALAGRQCVVVGGMSDPANYRVNAVYYDPGNPRWFYIHPAPPYGAGVYIVLSCMGTPPCYDWPEDRDETVAAEPPKLDLYEPWLIEYALYRAFIQDNESPTSIERSKTHWENGFKIITRGKMSDYAYHTPDFYLIASQDESAAKAVMLTFMP